MAIVSLPEKVAIHDLTKAVLQGGNEFNNITFIWSGDSKWCAFTMLTRKLAIHWRFIFEATNSHSYTNLPNWKTTPPPVGRSPECSNWTSRMALP
jgi:hypothetical protein